MTKNIHEKMLNIPVYKENANQTQVNMMFCSSMHLLVNDKISFFFMAE
jgi:hypothetical protein